MGIREKKEGRNTRVKKGREGGTGKEGKKGGRRGVRFDRSILERRELMGVQIG